MAEPITNVLGTVAIKHCGEYDATMHYEKLNVVTYNGSSYCAKTNTIGNSPTNINYWDLMAEKGDTGATGQSGYTPVKGVDYYTTADKNELEYYLLTDVSNEVTEQLTNLTSATPIAASSTSDMTDTSRIYVLTTDGHWYWNNGTTWVDGGVYQSASLDLDKNLTNQNKAPNSKIVGQKLQEKNFDLEYISGYKIVQNPNTYNKNTATNVVHDVIINENDYTFTVDANQTVKGISSDTFPLKHGKTYTLKFDVSLSDTTNPIKFYYRGGTSTETKNITGNDTISSVITPPATGNDLPIHFFIDNNTANSVTVSITNIVLFEGNIGDVKTLKDYNDEENNNELYKGVSLETTNSGTYTSDIYVEAGKDYKIDITDVTSNCNIFSSNDTSVTVVRVTTKGVYYFSPTVSGKLSTYAFNSSNFHLKGKVYLLKQEDTLYVSTSGNDQNNGLTPDKSLATIQKAIDLGARKILVKRGKYYHQTIKLTGNEESLSIKPYDYTTYTDDVKDRPLIEIINGTKLENLQQDSTYSSLLSQNFEGNAAWNAVFITHTLQPSTTGYRGYNNAGLWQISGTETYSNDKRVNPVLTINECLSTVGTFFWDGTKVYINPYNTEYEEFVVQDAIDYGIELRNLNKLDLQDISVKFSKQSNFYLNNCMDMHLNNCISQYTNVINGFQMNNSNGVLENCQAYNSRDDGFGAQEYGVTSYLNCIGNYNDDDGISHHYGERALIIGGEYSYNGKGGVASPTYGAYVNVYNVYTHHNDVGIYATNESETRDYATRTCFANNCLITNNRIGIRTGGTTKIIGWNNIIKDNTTNVYGPGYIDNDAN